MTLSFNDVQVSTTGTPYQLCAGGVDGNIRVWKNIHCREGGQQPNLDWRVHDGKKSECNATNDEPWLTMQLDAVSSTTVHPSGTVVATCSGQRHFETDQHVSSECDTRSDDEIDTVIKTTFDNSLKLWAI